MTYIYVFGELKFDKNIANLISLFLFFESNLYNTYILYDCSLQNTNECSIQLISMQQN